MSKLISILALLSYLYISCQHLHAQAESMHFKYLESLEAEYYSDVRNSSFEDFQGRKLSYNRSFDPWVTCGFESTSPATHCVNGHTFFNIETEAYSGESFVNLVVRADTTIEAIGQPLPNSLQPDQKYYLGLFACRSNEIKSHIKNQTQDDEMVSFRAPTEIVIMGGSNTCDLKEELARSTLVSNVSWMEYAFTFTPQNKVDWIYIRAAYTPNPRGPYTGNVCIDDISDIYLIQPSD